MIDLVRRLYLRKYTYRCIHKTVLVIQCSSVQFCPQPSNPRNFCLYPALSSFFLQCFQMGTLVCPRCVCPRMIVSRVTAKGDAGGPSSQQARAILGSSVSTCPPLMVDQLVSTLLCWLPCSFYEIFFMARSCQSMCVWSFLTCTL